MTLTVQGRMQQKTVEGLWEQGRHVARLLSVLTEADYDAPAGVPLADDVRTLLAWLVVHEAELLAALGTSTSARPVSIGDHFLGVRIRRHARVDVVRELAAHESGPTLASQFRQQMDEIRERVGEPTLAPVVTMGTQPLRTIDLLRVTAVELLLSTDDLARALPGREVAWSRVCLTDATRALAEIVAHRHPGRSIELRVPPHAAVQCGTGDDTVHTRGTPPNVVEVEPLVLLRLVHGRTRFADEVAAGRIHASGSRSDLSSWFPLLG